MHPCMVIWLNCSNYRLWMYVYNLIWIHIANSHVIYLCAYMQIFLNSECFPFKRRIQSGLWVWNWQWQQQCTAFSWNHHCTNRGYMCSNILNTYNWPAKHLVAAEYNRIIVCMDPYVVIYLLYNMHTWIHVLFYLLFHIILSVGNCTSMASN